ncbi:MAG: hypothetical protein ACOYJ6_05830 [Caulobacterales bacterium]|jgi:hypothetical protein
MSEEVKDPLRQNLGNVLILVSTMMGTPLLFDHFQGKPLSEVRMGGLLACGAIALTWLFSEIDFKRRKKEQAWLDSLGRPDGDGSTT